MKIEQHFYPFQSKDAMDSWLYTSYKITKTYFSKEALIKIFGEVEVREYDFLLQNEPKH